MSVISRKPSTVGYCATRTISLPQKKAKVEYKMLDAIIDLWSDAKERCNQLEKTSREMKKKIAALEMELQIASINSINLIDPMNSFK